MSINYIQSQKIKLTKQPRSVITLRGAQFSVFVILANAGIQRIFLFSTFYILFSIIPVSAITSVNTSNKNVVINGLVAHWTFDGKDTTWTTSATGTTRDLSGNGNTGTLSNMNRAAASVAGKISQGFKFSGSEVINTPNALLSSTVPNGFSTFVWVKTTSTSSSFIYEMGGSDALVLFSGPNGFQCHMDDTNSVYHSTPYKNGYSDGKWHHFGCVFDRTTNVFTLYIDSSSSTSVYAGSFSGFRNYDGKFHLGGRIYNSSGLIGSLDEMRVYNRALSLKEIQSLYKAGGGTTQASVSNIKTNTNSVGVSNGLLGHWTFDGKDMTNATATDMSGMGKNGTLRNMTGTSSRVKGKIGQALNFKGGTDYVATPSITFPTSTTGTTICSWVRPTGDPGYYKSIFRAGSSIAFSLASSNKAVYLYSLSTGNSISGATYLTLNKWWYVCGSISGSASNNVWSVYVNGVLDGSNVSTLNSSSNAGRIGNDEYGQAFKGDIDDLRIYNRALSAKEIQSLYKLGQNTANVTPTVNISGISNGLVAHWTFDGKDTPWTSSTTGTTKDVTGNGNTGTLTNMSRTTAPKKGKIGQGIKFDGVNDYINLGTPANHGFTGTSSEFTITGWVKPSVTSRMGFVKRGPPTSGTPSAQYVLGTYVNNNLEFAIGNGTIDSTLYTGNNSLPLNNWSFISCGMDVVNLFCYINGVFAGQISRTINASGNGGVATTIIGTRSTTFDFFKGDIDDVRIYNRALSVKEIQALYKMGSQ